jgi:hypothetical protein
MTAARPIERERFFTTRPTNFVGKNGTGAADGKHL